MQTATTTRENIKMMLKLIFTWGILSATAFAAVSSYETVEYFCRGDSDCQTYEHTGVKAKCVLERCLCLNADKHNVTCEPRSTRMNNIIGGLCPCLASSMSECHEEKNFCDCIVGYVPTADRRRCIPAFAQAQKCEADFQCTNMDLFSTCNKTSGQCECLPNAIFHKIECQLVIGGHMPCNDTEPCDHPKVIYKNCSQKDEYCRCEEGFVSVKNRTECVRHKDFGQECHEEIECKGLLGVGGICREEKCDCDDKYYLHQEAHIRREFLEEKYTHEKCVRKVELGQYCRKDGDCRHMNMTTGQLPLYCSYSECRCENDLIYSEQGYCLQPNKAGLQLRADVMAIALMAAAYFGWRSFWI